MGKVCLGLSYAYIMLRHWVKSNTQMSSYSIFIGDTY